MPKDPTKNVDRYKIRGGHLNEFNFHRNQAELAEKQGAPATNLIPGTPPEGKTVGLRPVVAKAKAPAKKKAAKSTKATTGSKATKGTKGTKGSKATKGTRERKAPVGASAKKLAAQKAAKKK